MKPFAMSLGVAGILVCLGMAPASAQVPPPPPPPPTQQSPPPPPPPPMTMMDHSAHMAEAKPQEPSTPIPPVTEADREAAFPAGLDGHRVHDDAINFMVLFDQTEWHGRGAGSASWSNRSWVGGDINRLWLRTEGETEDGRVDAASVDVLWGHSFSRWWDVVAGARQEARPGPGRTWAAIGLQGLAPYWFEVEATGYLGEGGRTQLKLEVEYEVLLSQRWILQPLVEVDVFGKSDPARGIGAGVSSLETGLRLRYEWRREVAPYVGLTWNRKFFGTADLARDQGHDVGRGRLTFGLRTWF